MPGTTSKHVLPHVGLMVMNPMVEKEINMLNKSKLLGILIPPELIYFWEEKGMKAQRKQGPEGDLS